MQKMEERTAFTVKSTSGFKNEGGSFQYTPLTYTLVEEKGTLGIGIDRSATITEETVSSVRQSLFRF